LTRNGLRDTYQPVRRRHREWQPARCHLVCAVVRSRLRHSGL